MDFQKLSYLLAIAKYKNLSKAAEALYVGQPTLSKFLSALESEIGVKLFQKYGNRYELTYAGRCYLAKAAEILKLKAELDTEISDIRDNDIGELKLAFASMRITYTLPRTLPEFSARHPNVKISVIDGSSDENDRRLLDGSVELAFYTRPVDENPQLEYHHISSEELLICTCHGHPLSKYAYPNPNSKYPMLDISLLQNERVLLMQPQQRTRQAVDRILQNKKLKLRNTVEISSIPAIIGLTANGYGVSFVFDSHLDHHADPHDIECFSFGDEGIFRDFVAASRKGSYLSKYAREYIEIVRAAVNKAK